MSSRSRSEAVAQTKGIKVTQVRSVIDRPKDQKDTVRRLGLHRMHDSVVKDDSPDVRGMIAKVRHLLQVEELGSGAERRGRDGKEEQA
jgi:large subunit ribosomal protein L30